MKMPREFEQLDVRGTKDRKRWFCLSYSKERGFFEPITNQDARPFIGKTTEWRYRTFCQTCGCETTTSRKCEH